MRRPSCAVRLDERDGVDHPSGVPEVGGLFVIETVSVIVQVAVFRLTGRRVFRMAPLHHHFELLGWQETTIIVRFWIIAGITVSLALMAFYTEYLTRIGVSP